MPVAGGDSRWTIASRGKTFSTNIQDGKVVPILGHELLQAEYLGRRVTLQRLLAERLAEREKLEVQWNPHFELNDAVSAYLANPQAKPGGLYDRIAGFLRSLNPRRSISSMSRRAPP